MIPQVQCSTYHWEDISTIDRARVRRFLEAYNFHDSLLLITASRQYFIMSINPEIRHALSELEHNPWILPPASTPGHRYTPPGHRYTSPASAHINGRWLILLRNLSGRGGNFQIISVDTQGSEGVKSDADLMKRISAAYPQSRLDRFWYGDPYAIGYISVGF